MNPSNCKHENVRAGTRRQACRRVPAAVAFPLPYHKAESIHLPLALFHFALCPSPLPFPFGKRFGHGIDRFASQPQRGYRIVEAAEYMGVTPWFVEVKIRSGELPALKLCRHYTILKQDMDTFLDRQRAALLDKHRSSLTQSAKDAA